MRNLQEIKQELFNDFITIRHRKKFKPNDIELIEKFIRETEKLTPEDRQMKLNRLWIDNHNKPKNWLFIHEFIQFILSRQFRS